MLHLEAAFKREGLDAHLILQIHDELLISVAQSQQEQASRVIKQVLESVVHWSIPLQVTTRSGNDWKAITK